MFGVRRGDSGELPLSTVNKDAPNLSRAAQRVRPEYQGHTLFDVVRDYLVEVIGTTVVAENEKSLAILLAGHARGGGSGRFGTALVCWAKVT